MFVQARSQRRGNRKLNYGSWIRRRNRTNVANSRLAREGYGEARGDSIQLRAYSIRSGGEEREPCQAIECGREDRAGKAQAGGEAERDAEVHRSKGTGGIQGQGKAGMKGATIATGKAFPNIFQSIFQRSIQRK